MSKPSEAGPWSTGVPPRLLSTRLEGGLYALAWSVFTVGFAAVFWLQSRNVGLSSLRSAALVVFPAALLGIAVIHLSEGVSLRQPAGIAIHVAACLAYPALWIGAVNVMNNVVTYGSTGVVRWRLPPPHVVHWHYLAGTMIYTALAALTYGRTRLFQAEQKRLWAEWRVLRGQLNPHFLFNTLHTVFGLAQLEPAAGEVAITRFSRVLRYALVVNREERELVRLRDEWNFTEDYLQLESLRLDGRLSWRTEIHDDAQDVWVPSLLVQPLVENAVRHSGVVGGASVRITVTARRIGNVLHLRVSDDGQGCTRDAALGSPGIGLRAARTRVQRLTARSDAFVIETRPGAGFAVTLLLPGALTLVGGGSGVAPRFEGLQ